jgi:hypothetical protein
VRGLLVVFVVLVVTTGLFVIARAWLADRARAAPWRLEERSEDGAVRLLAVRAGDAPLELGAVPVGEEDFDSQLYELRAQARAKLAALNDR